MSKKIELIEYKRRTISEDLNGSEKIIWVRDSDQASAAALFSAGERRFRLDVVYSDKTSSVFMRHKSVPYDIIKIAEDIAFSSTERVSDLADGWLCKHDPISEKILEYIREDVRKTNEAYMIAHHTIKKVIFSGRATVVIWMDGTKTIVKCMEGDIYDPEKALMMCVIERILGGSKMEVKRFFKKWIKKELEV